ncbi:oxidoreductase [Friedmanniella luteola]|uniref:oxidoreductase n=1 Tax=Friedmanniella luteola TaxID=546871 RepID=UPI001E529F8E|nr:oxidoreductase [Friedmanniella luteola]
MWLITGASSGFGRSVAEAALVEGFTVVAAVRRPDALGELAEKASVVELDVTDLDAMPGVVDQVLAEHGRIDVLVNNAGRGHLGAAEETTDDELRQLMDLHFFGPTALTRLVLPSMRDRRSGAIVQMSSMGGRTTFPGVGAYSASKYALEGWSEALAAELQPFGIKVLIVEPGAFRTGFNTAGAIGTSTPIDAYDNQLGPLRNRFAEADGQQPGDPAKAAAAIISALAQPNPPLHLPLGPDAVESIRTNLANQQAELDAWIELSNSTNVDP